MEYSWELEEEVNRVSSGTNEVEPEPDPEEETDVDLGREVIDEAVLETEDEGDTEDDEKDPEEEDLALELPVG